MADKETKQGALNEIAALLGVPPRLVARGSTEPKEAFLDVIGGLKLPISHDLRKPALGKAIANAAGLGWERECDSTWAPSGGGDTVTLAGVQRVREAVQVLLNAPPSPAQVDGVRGRPYAQVPPAKPSTTAVFERDPEAIDRSSNAHISLQNRIASALEGLGLEPLTWNADAGDPPFDIAWRADGTLYVCEVKSATETNRHHQVRLGLGQLLEYGARVHAQGETSVVLVLALELPVLAIHRRACELAEIRYVSLPSLDTDLAGILAPSPPL